MRSFVGVGGVLVLALATISGCASWGRGDEKLVVVDYYAGTTDLSGYPGMGVGAGNALTGSPGIAEKVLYQPLEVRRCNVEMTECSLGIVDLSSQVTILSVGSSTAKVQVDLNYKVGAEYRRESPGSSVVAKLSVPEVIHGQGTITRSADLPYGEIRNVELPYGVAFTLCVSPPGVSNIDIRPCASKLRVKDPSGLKDL
ncbi:hypothetical protein J2T41_005284 [Pseudomonas citronellolis]|uniref:hypothetical protein n=1 Tax=Pseudomonas citronellolis TaxID=53408 RepID=UPI0020A02303|nr:hypothetical protein [Pseudomonas citronellolis]MCP1645638.1 hypothetical protein [Pseudomonas citronellolis]MCP1667490.1 hypothetical protein [Pseudomonas citronellolis]MCP1699910.1 hypothetical protein [Pseudomonas citronellolis]MCP1705352.1 hypothetical protein [Pseudomonas citronellolis]MCP1800058.1 hypothetical protein [Pseudomonas citronellolis]